MCCMLVFKRMVFIHQCRGRCGSLSHLQVAMWAIGSSPPNASAFRMLAKCLWLFVSCQIDLPLSNEHKQLLFGISASIIDGVFVIAASYAGCDAILVGLFFTIAVGAQGLHTSSTMINAMDLSPNYAGTITGISNGISSCTGIVVPWIIGVMTPNV